VHRLVDLGDQLAVLEEGDTHAIGVRTFDYDGTELSSFGWDLGAWGGDQPVDIARAPNGDWAVAARADLVGGISYAYLRFDAEGRALHSHGAAVDAWPVRVLLDDAGRVFGVGNLSANASLGLVMELRP
jgi:hypothetical protein